MDTRIIEVAIGLVLVFAISSLLVTTLHEIWTSLRKSRGDSLLLGVCSLLGDNQVTVGKMRRRMVKAWQPSPFTDDLLAHPLLVSQSLGSADQKRTPSYLPSDVFVTALIAQLSKLHTQNLRLETPQQWINAVIAGADVQRAAGDTHQPRPEPLEVLATLAQGVESDWPTYELRLRAWYDSVMERSAGWFRRDTQLRLVILGFVAAAVINLNPLVIAPRLWNDPALRATTTALAQEAVKAYADAASASASGAAASAPAAAAAAASAVVAAANRRTAAAAAPAATVAAPATPQALESNQALTAAKEALFAAAEATRVHRADNAALVVQDALNRLLDLQDQVLLRRSVASRAELPTDVFEASAIVEDHLATLEAHLIRGKDLGHDVAKGQFERLKTALRAERDALLPDNARARRAGQAAAPRVPQACLTTDDKPTEAMCQPLEALQALAGSGLPIGWDWANWPGCDATCQARHGPERSAGPDGPTPDRYAQALAASRAIGPGAAAEPRAVTARELRALYLESRREIATAAARDGGWQMLAWWDDPDARADMRRGLISALLGWLIIGIAASLGAPFWFDLLNRVVKLRGSGAAAGAGTPAAAGGTAPPPDTMVRPPAPPPGPPPDAPAAPAAPADNGALNAAERDLRGEQIVRLQNAIGLTGADASGRFDATTRTAIMQWQQDRREGTVNGELSAAQIGLLLAPVAPPPAAPVTAPARSRTPLRANGTINVLSIDDVRALYGDIATVPLANGAVRIERPGLPGKAQLQIVDFNHRLLANTQRVHARALPHFTAVFDAIDAAGLGNRIVNCAGTFVPRHIGSNPNRPLSRHTWGIAIDLNSAANAMGAQPAAIGQPGSVLELVDIFNRFGFAWGGHFSSGPDGMHFELALRQP